MDFIQFFVALFVGSYQQEPMFFLGVMCGMISLALLSVYVGEHYIMKHSKH